MKSDHKMNFLIGLETIRLSNSLFGLIEPYTKDVMLAWNKNNNKYEYQTKPKVYRCKQN